MSGLYKILVILLGVISVVLVMFLINRMREKDGYKLDPKIRFGTTARYIVWLSSEVIKSNWEVMRIILSKQPGTKQKFIEIPISQKSDLGKVIFANSITLTPGTVTVETEAKKFLIHVLNHTAATFDDLNNMNDKVATIEKQ